MLQRVFAVGTLVVATLFLPAQTTAANPKSDVAAVLKQFNTALATGNAKSLVSSCASATAIIDEFPPFLWHGNACAAWFSAFGKLVKSAGMTNIRFTASAANPLNITGNTAYAVVPARLTWTDKKGAHWETVDGTFIVQRAGGVWKIGAVAWAVTGSGPAH
jgi:hypothetical protein